MIRHVKIIRDILSKSTRFEHVIIARESVYVANQLRDLTAFCHLMIRRRQGLTIVDCELCLTVLPESDKAESQLQTNIEERRFVSAIITTPPRNTLDHLVTAGQMTDWLFQCICGYLERYSLDAESAIAWLDQTDDPLVRAMRVIYGDKFENFIVMPLCALVRANNSTP